ncbi:hypothetical protein EWM62_05495 [Mucilaginibacter terrigena]|uniref:NACHT domain-containing protein n=1 Tax=Mucilaginibacter terrigena TaxID=2492395 RepID=A0A4Q5LPQ3_9SPHI|nr:hypothetical protein [Mucilaginibacter terrigena]RYU91396.1 hypothetical protein EWM62_05495 [Mucilaginibacter terrigena]
MTSLLPQFYELLKKTVLTTSGIINITPCDCKSISIDIFNKTKLSISETTLKRIYGFAYSKFNPSLFSVDVMAKYCGYLGWDDFCQKHSKPTKPVNTASSWEVLKVNAGKTTYATLQILRNKFGIPYSQTIKRHFIDDHFNEFLNFDYSATVFAAPAGYGKTIALCHWVEERLKQNEAGKTNDIILFFSISGLTNVLLSGQDLNHWLLTLLGYPADTDAQALMNTRHEKEGNFFLIVDDLDESVCKPEQFKLLLKQFIDILNLYNQQKWFKLVLTMRSATWINNSHELEDGNTKWFKGFTTNGNPALNVPLFNIQELKELSLKINPACTQAITTETAKKFDHPLYLQFYYKQHKGDFCLGNADNVCIYELVSTFVLNKVYLGSQSTDKILFLKGLVDIMCSSNSRSVVAKTSINSLIKQHHHAYIELINIGFIREINNSTNLHYEVSVQFTDAKFFEYTYSKTLLHRNNLLFDEALINTINKEFENSEHKLPILKWCILYVTRTGQHNNFDVLVKAGLTLSQKSDLILFMGDLFEKEYTGKNRPESLTQNCKHLCSAELFNYLFELAFINASYEKTLTSLLKFNLKPRKQILTYTALALIAVTSLDMDTLKAHLQKLNNIPIDDYDKFAINPLRCLDAIYSYLKNGVIKKEVFYELTQFYFNPPIEGNYFNNTVANDMMFLLAAHTLQITQNPKKILRFVKVLDKYFNKNDATECNEYTYRLNTLIADCLFRLERKDELLNMFNHLSVCYKRDKSALPDHMKEMYYAMRIKVNSLSKNYKYLIEDVASHALVAGQQKLSKIAVMSIILNNPDITDLYPKFCKQCQYDHSRLLRESGVHADLFAGDLFYNKL